jgi:predicted DNA binding CopG/RHH family protein
MAQALKIEQVAPVRIVTKWEDVPQFEHEQDEAAFWAEHRVDVRLMDAAMVSAAETTESVTITLRMDPRMLSRIKRLARSRYLNYQSMIKQWLSERMEQELKERQ